MGLMPCRQHHTKWKTAPTPGRPKIHTNVHGRPAVFENRATTPRQLTHLARRLHLSVPSSKRPKSVEPVATTAAEKNHSDDIPISFRRSACMASSSETNRSSRRRTRRCHRELPLRRLSARCSSSRPATTRAPPLHGHSCYYQRRDGVRPPQSEEGV